MSAQIINIKENDTRLVILAAKGPEYTIGIN